MHVPLVDLKLQTQLIENEVKLQINSVLERCDFVLGNAVHEFEENFARFSGTRFAIGVASGTDAIHLATQALNLHEGDEVLIPAHTFIATALGVIYSGARPIPVDVDPMTFNMDPNLIESKITPQTKALLPVHLYGRMMDLKPLEDIASKYNLFLYEDVAQAHGAHLGKRSAGSIGELGCFSFYPGKNLGAFGDAGMITTDDEDLKNKICSLRNYGSPKKYHHPIVGFNSRLDTIQAVILNIKLKYLETYNKKRFQHAMKYNHLLEGVGDLIVPQIPETGSHVFHLYVIRTKKRDELLTHLQKNQVGCAIHYPTPIHLHGAFKYLGFKKGDFPVSENISNEILSLPLFPELTEEQIHYVVTQIENFF